MRNGTANTITHFGLSMDLPVTGDWNGDGFWDVGVFRNPTHKFYLGKTGNGMGGAGDTLYTFGNSGDSPVVGKWS